MPKDTSGSPKELEPLETGKTPSASKGPKSHGPNLEPSHPLQKARRWIRTRQEEAAIDLLEDYLEANPSDEEALELLLKAYENDEAIALRKEVRQGYFVQEATPEPRSGTGRLEGWEVVEDKVHLPVGAPPEEVSIEEEQEEAPRSKSSPRPDKECLAGSSLNEWLSYDESYSIEGVLELSLKFVNVSDETRTIRLTNVDYPPGLWPPGETKFPWRVLQSGEIFNFQDIRYHPEGTLTI